MDLSSYNDTDPEMAKAMAGMDEELKLETSNSSVPMEEDGPLKFKSLNTVVGDLQKEQEEDAELAKSAKRLSDEDGQETRESNDDQDGHVNSGSNDDQMEAALASLGNATDFAKSLADLDGTDALPNAASLLELDVDDATNHRLSLMLHRMGKIGAQIKEHTRRIDSLHRLHQATQKGSVSLLQLHDDDITKDPQGLMSLADGDKMVDKDLAFVQSDPKWHPAQVQVASELGALSQTDKASSEKASLWLDSQIAKQTGGEKIDHEADDKILDAMIAKIKAKSSQSTGIF